MRPRRLRPALVLVLAACGGSRQSCRAPLEDLSTTDPAALTPGNESGQDEDPSILIDRFPDALFAAFYSNRLGTHPDGLARKEIFVTRSTDGKSWSAPGQATDSHAWSFYPSLVRERGGGNFHLAWMRWHLLPDGCIYFDAQHCPGTAGCCTGTDRRILHNVSSDGLTWSESAAQELTAGPDDEMPNVVAAADGRILVYFVSGYRGGDTQRKLGVVVFDGAGWHSPVLLTGLDSTQNDSFPQVVERAGNSFLMTWTRYDQALGENVFDPSAETMLATSSDGLDWTDVRVASGPSPAKTDVFPFLYSDLSGAFWWVLWVNEDGVVNLPVDGIFPQDLAKVDISGYSPRVAPTPSEGIYWAVWVGGSDPTQQIMYRFMP
ncbi:MAG TPA: sialidase family protein [Myxococcales bacterium]|nr:sialidase family protein [Myxococcales bacterium]